MTDPNSLTQSQTAASLLQSGNEADMLLYLLNQQTQTPDHWQLPDGSSVIRHPDTRCYEFVSPGVSAELLHVSIQPPQAYINSEHLIGSLLKQAATEAGISAADADDPPLSAAEALSICPELSKLIDEALDNFEPDDHILSWLEHEASYMAADIRREITRDHWQAIVAAIRERARQEP